MYLEKAKLEEFEAYYEIKCEKFNTFWTWGNYELPPRENLYRFYCKCLQSMGEVRKDIYLIKDAERQIVGYMYMDYHDGMVDIPIALKENETGKGYARYAIKTGLAIAKGEGITRSEVEIREDNESSIRLYIACGYKKGRKTREVYSEVLKKTIFMYVYECVID